MPTIALLLLFACLPLGSAALEISTALAVVAALVWGRRRETPLLGPVLVITASLLLSSLGRGELAGLGRAWALVLALAVPMLVIGLSREQLRKIENIGLIAACLVALLALLQVGLAGVPPWVQPVAGPFSHHLTLGFALLVPFARALDRRRWLVALILALGVGAAGSQGPALSLLVVTLAVAWRADAALALGVSLALLLIAAMVGQPHLHERALLWATGTELAVSHPLGVGAAGFRDAATVVQHALQPGFFYPYHAHDSALQIAALGGLSAWVGWAWLGLALWRHTGRAGKAALAGLLVGALTQDTLGDLEVIRALCAWALLPSLSSHEPDTISTV